MTDDELTQKSVKMILNKSQDEVTFDDTRKLKQWLFAESMRLEELRKELEDERELINTQKGILLKQQRKNSIYKAQLDSQKALFEQQWAIMEAELRKIAAEKDNIQHEKDRIRDEAYREARKDVGTMAFGRKFFNGITDGDSLRKRYRELMKIYHPDNKNGDSDTLLAITKEYERLKQMYFD